MFGNDVSDLSCNEEVNNAPTSSKEEEEEKPYNNARCSETLDKARSCNWSRSVNLNWTRIDVKVSRNVLNLGCVIHFVKSVETHRFDEDKIDKKDVMDKEVGNNIWLRKAYDSQRQVKYESNSRLTPPRLGYFLCAQAAASRQLQPPLHSHGTDLQGQVVSRSKLTCALDIGIRKTIRARYCEC